MQKITGGDPLAAKQDEYEINKKNEKQGMGNYILNIILFVILFLSFLFLKDRITRFCVEKLPTYICHLEKIPNSGNELCINVIFYEDFIGEACKY